MGTNRLAVHTLVIVLIAVLALGARERSGGVDAPGDTGAVLVTESRAAGPGRMVYYGRLGTPFLSRDGRIALSGAPLRREADEPRPDRRSCPAQAVPVRANRPLAAPELGRRSGA